MKARSWLAAALAAGAAAAGWAGCSAGETRVVVAAGTTLVDGGLLERVAADYEAGRPGVELIVVGAPTARVLALARSGSADVTITHDPDQEERFLAEGGADEAAEVFSSRFILAGPPRWARGLEGLGAGEAFGRIARRGHLFVSRADGSGTYQRERRIWDAAGVDPTGRDWYLETRQGMGLTLQVASQKEGFVLVEWSVYLAGGQVSGLADARLDPGGLENPYRAMAVKGSPAGEAAADFVGWLRSSPGQESVRRAGQELYGREVFEP